MQKYVLDRNGNVVATFASDYNDKHTKTLDAGASTYEFTISKQDEAALFLETGNYVNFVDDLGKPWSFSILSYTENHNEKTVYCEDVGIELINKNVNAYKADTAYSFAFYFEMIAKNTPWTIGINEIGDLSRKLEWTSNDTGLSRLLSLLTEFDNAECKFNVKFAQNKPTEFKVDIYKQIGNPSTNVQIVYSNELNDITKTESRAEFVTAIQGEGGTPTKNADGTDIVTGTNPDGTTIETPKITFADIEYKDDNYISPKGDNFLRAVTANKLFNPNSQDTYIEGYYSYDTLSAQELLNRTLTQLKKYSAPQYKYEADVQVIDKNLDLGDTVKIIDHDYKPGLYLSARVASLEKSYTDPSKNTITFTNYKLINSSLAQKLADLQNIINSMPTASGISSIVTNVINNSNVIEQKILALQSADGRSTVYYDSKPSNAKEGDTAFVKNPNSGNMEIWNFVGDQWALTAGDATFDDVKKQIDKAQTDAQAAITTANNAVSTANDNATKFGTDFTTLKADVTKSVADVGSKADKAIKSANEVLEQIGTAKTDLTTSITKEVTDRANAVTALDTKAKGYADTAKTDAQSALDALQVGGRNLLLNTNTNDYNTLNAGNGQYTTKYVPFDGGYKYQFTYTTASTNWAVYQFWGLKKDKFEPDTDYVLSFMANFSVPITPSVLFANGASGNNFVQQKTKPTVPSGSDQRVVIQLHTNTTIPTASDQSLYMGNFQGGGAGTFTIWDLKIEKGNKATDYTQAPEDIVLDYTTKDNKIKETITQYTDTNDGRVTKAQTTAQTAVDGLELKVSKTDYDQKTGDLSTKISDVKQTADSYAQTIADIKTADGKQDARMSEIENTASGLKSTVSDLSTAQGKQSGSISTLQQRADGFEATVTKVNGLSVGGRNLLTGTSSSEQSYTDDFSTIHGWDWSSYPPGSQPAVNVGSTYTYSIYLTKLTGSFVLGYWGFDSNKNYSGWFHSAVYSSLGKVSWTFTIPSGISYISPHVVHASDGFTCTVKEEKLETGNLPTDWSPAPEDVDSATAKAQLTADNASLALSNYKTDADGRISKAQADIIVNANAITQKVSQSDYNTKTGDLDSKYTAVKQTASDISQSVSDVKAKVDGVNKTATSAKTLAETNAESIKNTVTKTELTTAKSEWSSAQSTITAGQISTEITKVNQTITDATKDLVSQTVLSNAIVNSESGTKQVISESIANISVGGRNLFLNSRVLADSYGINFGATVTVESFDSTTNMWHIASPQNNGTRVGIYIYRYADNKIATNSHWSYSADIKGTGRPTSFGIELGQKNPVVGSIGSDWSRISQTGYINDNTKTIIMYFDTTNAPLDVYIKLPKLEVGNLPTDWSPAPEDQASVIAVNAIEQTVDGMKQTVANAATKTEVTTLAGQVTSTISAVQGGGINLYTDTKNFNNLASWNGSGAWTKTTDTYKELAVAQTTQVWGGLCQYIQVKKGDVLTYSAYVRNVSGTGTSPIFWQLNSQTEGSYSTATTNIFYNGITITNSWQRISVTNVATSDGYLRPRLERSPNNTNTMQIAGIKVEKGSIATPWSAAPEDIQSQFTQTQSMIDARVEKNGVVNAINISPESIQIYGNKLHITATTYIDSGIITNAMIANATITGAQIANATIVDANIANINGNKITANSITANQIAANSITADKLAVNAIQVGLSNYLQGGALSITPNDIIIAMPGWHSILNSSGLTMVNNSNGTYSGISYHNFNRSASNSEQFGAMSFQGWLAFGDTNIYGKGAFYAEDPHLHFEQRIVNGQYGLMLCNDFGTGIWIGNNQQVRVGKSFDDYHVIAS